MPEFTSKHIGRISYTEKDVLEFPAGLPGFEQERSFLPVEVASAKPLVMLQSLKTPELCFLTLPVLSIEPAYQLNLAREDLKVLGLPEDPPLRIGQDVLCVVIVCLTEKKAPTVNLLAPIIVNPKNGRAVQAIQVDSNYSHQHELPVPEPEPEVTCS